jgi:TM2 domain-containing membrane protein YozV
VSSYYFAAGNDRKGPFTLEELRGQGVRPEMLVWTEGMADWQPASSVPELSPLFGPPVPPGPGFPPPPPPPSMQYASPMTSAPAYNQADVNSKKILAGLMGILFGGLGIHKFVLGFSGTGAIMLCVSVLSCGFGAAVMGPVGLIEGIMYLTKSDADFYQQYIVEKKQWF